MKRLFRNNYVEVSLAKAIVLGVVYENEVLTILIGCVAIEIKVWMFNPKKKKPQTF